MKKFLCILLASLAAPLVVPVLMMIFFAVLSLPTTDTGDAVKIILWMGYISAALSYGFMFVFLLPVLLFMRWRDRSGRKQQMIGGLVCGVIFGLLLSLWTTSVSVAPASGEMWGTLLALPFFGGCGCLMGWCYWWLADAPYCRNAVPAV